VPSAEQLAGFLGPQLADTLDRCGMTIDPAQLEQARAGVAALARRHRRTKRAQLRAAAAERVRALAGEVCQAAAQLRNAAQAGTSDEAAARTWRQRAEGALRKAAAALPAIALSLVFGVSPPQLEQNVSAWARDAAAEVVLMYHAAELAQPGLAISLPGPGLGTGVGGPEAELEEPEAEAGF
jgi:hypothetical protein